MNSPESRKQAPVDKEGHLRIKSGCNKSYYQKAKDSAQKLIAQHELILQAVKDNVKALSQMDIGGIYEIEYTEIDFDGSTEKGRAICQICKIMNDTIFLVTLAGNDHHGLDIPIDQSGIGNRGLYSIQSVKPARKEDLLPYISADFFSKELDALMKNGRFLKNPTQNSIQGETGERNNHRRY